MAQEANKEGTHVEMAGASTVGGRVAWLDSLKGILIFLVVFGHVLLPAPKGDGILLLTYSSIYVFHMPLFVFVSGLLSKHAIDSGGSLRADRVLTYLFFGLAFNFVLRVAEGGPVTFEKLVSFPSAPWYLISLAFWHAAVPFLARLRPGAGIALTALVSVGASVMEPQTDIMAISRTAHFFPYFAAGYYLSLDNMAKLREKRVRAACLVAGLGALVSYAVFFDQLRPLQFFVYGNNACSLPLSTAIPGYLLISAVGVALSLGLIAIAPGTDSFIVVMGSRTLQIYVIHRLIREWMERAGFYEIIAELDVLPLLTLLLGISIIICIVASWSGFTKATEKVMGLGWSFMLKE